MSFHISRESGDFGGVQNRTFQLSLLVLAAKTNRRLFLDVGRIERARRPFVPAANDVQ
jgi:hypothetical protein